LALFGSSGKNSSMREIPSIPIFCVISTAQVLHGVIISRRGPINGEGISVASSISALPKSQYQFLNRFVGEKSIGLTPIMLFRLCSEKTIIIYIVRSYSKNDLSFEAQR